MIRIGSNPIALSGLLLTGITVGAIAPAAGQTCSQWKVAGIAWYADQSNGTSTQIVLSQNGTNLTGQGMYCPGGWTGQKGQCPIGLGGGGPIRGQIDGTIQGKVIQFTVYWGGSKEGGSVGVYTGTIGPTGRIDGASYDKVQPNVKATWYSDTRMECASSADAAPTPATQTPAETRTGKVLGRVPTTGSAPQRSICDAARDARARNSPAAPGLEAQCRASQQATQQTPPGTPETQKPPSALDLPVKKSSSNICYSPGSTDYNQITSFTPYKTIDECVKGGGRLASSGPGGPMSKGKPTSNQLPGPVSQGGGLPGRGGNPVSEDGASGRGGNPK